MLEIRCLSKSPICRPDLYRYAGWIVTARIPVNFGTAHGRSRPEVGSTKRSGASDKKGVSQVSLI